MGYSTVTAVKSNSQAGLLTKIATAIGAGKQPYGHVFVDPLDGQLCMLMTTGVGNSGLSAYASNGAIAPQAGKAMLTKAGVGAYTLAAPVSDGDELIIENTTANAHVVTATGLIQDGVTGGAKNTMTFAAFSGAGIKLFGYGGFWMVLGKNLVTIA